MKLVVIGTAVCFLGFSPSPGFRAAETQKPDEPKKLTVMQRKLVHAQKLLAALVKDDFKQIESAADELKLCASEASWQVVKSDKYERYSNDFIRDLADLKNSAKAKNTDKSALAYVGMTLTCVKCHQYVRDEKIGAAPDLKSFGLAAAK